MVDVQKKECATCTNWKPKESGEMAKHRMAICGNGPRWRFMAPGSSCAQFVAAAVDVVKGRLKWLG